MSLFVGRLNRVLKQDLEASFEKYGRLTRCDLKPQGYAFITYEDPRDADDAMRELQGTEITGCRINIEWSKESGRYHRNSFFESRSYGRSRRRSPSRSRSRSPSPSHSRSPRSRSRSRS